MSRNDKDYINAEFAKIMEMLLEFQVRISEVRKAALTYIPPNPDKHRPRQKPEERDDPGD